jgi:CubicO group peptidase (beta-lactamase class C family)
MARRGLEVFRAEKRRQVFLLFGGVVLTLSMLAGCGPGAPPIEELRAVDYAPLSWNDWEVSTPEEQGLDPLLVAELYYNAAELPTIYSLLVIKDDYLIAEDYFNEGSVEQKDRLQSVTKSFTSALVGIALEQGYLSSLDQKMLDFFPELAGQITDLRKEQITIREMLQMRAGYPWEETDPALWDGLLSGYYVSLIEEFPLIADPGTEFHYSNLTSMWLGIIVDRVTGKHLKAYAEENLFSPLGVEAGEWGTDAEGHNNGAGDLHFTARDAAKFGLLYLNYGAYEGKQIIPSGWVRESREQYSENINATGGFPANWGLAFKDIGYGYQWWSARAGEHYFDFAWGHGGQMIVLLEELDMVIVLTSYPFYLQHDDESWANERPNLNLVADFIKSLPAE